jgi:hypothetical protein
MFYDRGHRQQNALEEAQAGMGDYGDVSSGGTDETPRPVIRPVESGVVRSPIYYKPASEAAAGLREVAVLAPIKKPHVVPRENYAITVPEKVTRLAVQKHEYGPLPKTAKVTSEYEQGDITWLKPGQSAVLDEFREAQLSHYRRAQPVTPVQPAYQVETPEQVMARIQAQQLPSGILPEFYSPYNIQEESYKDITPYQAQLLAEEAAVEEVSTPPERQVEYQINLKKEVKKFDLNKLISDSKESIKSNFYAAASAVGPVTRAVSRPIIRVGAGIKEKAKAFLLESFKAEIDNYNELKEIFRSKGLIDAKDNIIKKNLYGTRLQDAMLIYMFRHPELLNINTEVKDTDTIEQKMRKQYMNQFKRYYGESGYYLPGREEEAAQVREEAVRNALKVYLKLGAMMREGLVKEGYSAAMVK